jgi:hypothetical protein
MIFFEKERNEPGGKILEKNRKQRRENRKQGGVYLRGEELGQNRRKRKKRGKGE